MGRSKIATLQFDFLASYDVLEALDDSRGPANAPPPTENWTESKANDLRAPSRATAASRSLN
jgi:hypothetical protein